MGESPSKFGRAVLWCCLSLFLVCETAAGGVVIPSPNSVIGDGKSAVFIPILSDTLDIRTTAKVDIGSVRPTYRNDLPGLIYTPPAVTATTTTTISVKIRGSEKSDLAVPVNISVPWSEGFSFQFDPQPSLPAKKRLYESQPLRMRLLRMAIEFFI